MWYSSFINNFLNWSNKVKWNPHRKTVAEGTTYFGRSRNGQLSVSSLSGHWLSSQESVGKVATIKQRQDGVTGRKAADVLLTPTSSSLSLSEPTLHRLWLDDSFWFWPEPWFRWSQKKVTADTKLTQKLEGKKIKCRVFVRNCAFNVPNRRSREKEGGALRGFFGMRNTLYFTLNLDLHPYWWRFPRWRLSVTWITSEFSRRHPIREGILSHSGHTEALSWLNPSKMAEPQKGCQWSTSVCLSVPVYTMSCVFFTSSLVLYFLCLNGDGEQQLPFLAHQRCLVCLIGQTKKKRGREPLNNQQFAVYLDSSFAPRCEHLRRQRDHIVQGQDSENTRRLWP